MSLKESMQVSMVMATLRAVTTRHRHTDRISGDTYHPKNLPSPVKLRDVREQKHPTGTNGAQSKLQVFTQMASKTCTFCKLCRTPYETQQRVKTQCNNDVIFKI